MARTPNKEEQILAAAKPLFMRLGPKRTTIDDIAQAAGLGKGTIYLYFPSKDDIFQAVVQGECEAMFERYRRRCDGTTSVEAKLRNYIFERLEHVHTILSTNGMTVELFNEARLAVEFLPLHAELRSREIGILSDLIREGVETGAFQVASVPFTALTLASALDACKTVWNLEGRDLSLVEKVDTLLELFLNGLHGRAQHTR